MARPAPGGLALRLLTINVNGLGSASNVAALLTWMREACSSPDVVMMQEVRLGDVEQLRARLRGGEGPGLPWRGQVFFSPGRAAGGMHLNGTAILVRAGGPLSGLPTEPTLADAEGRLVRVDCELLDQPLSLVSAYAPAQPSERPRFMASLSGQLPAGRHAIMAGDWNCVLEASDESRRSTARAVGAAQLRQVMDSHGLVDAWRRKRGPAAREYSHAPYNSQHSPARLDRFLVSVAVQPWVAAVQHVVCPLSDHDGVLLTVQPPDMPSLGKGGWVFPTYLLYHPAYKQRLVDLAQHAWQQLSASTPAGHAAQKWDAWKGLLAEGADSMHRAHRTAAAAAAWRDQAAAAVAHAALAEQPDDPVLQAAAAATRRNAADTLHKVAEDRRVAADAMFSKYGEGQSRWFYRLTGGKHAGEQRYVRALCVPGAAQPVQLTGSGARAAISAAASAMYSSDAEGGLFRPGVTDQQAQATLLGALSRRLDDRRRQEAEGPGGDGLFTLDCLAAALGRTHTGKMPGSDGLTYEVYRALWDTVGPMLLEVVNDVYTLFEVSDGDPSVLPRSWLEGVIAAIYKGKGLPREQLNSYRPLTLLNTDLKLVSLVLAGRLQGAAAWLVDHMQTAFVAGRDIADNALYHLSLLHHLAAAPAQPAALMIMDLRQAYDRADREWLHSVVGAMGFGAHARRWLRLLLSPSRAAVTINGHLSDWFPVRGGLAQGSPLSPLLWALLVEPLTAQLRREQRAGRISTPLLPGGVPAPPVGHHADDTKLLVSDADQDGAAAMQVVRLFCAASNSQLNLSKCHGVVLGSHPPITGVHATTGIDFGRPQQPGEPPPPPPRLLGVPLTADQHVAAGAAFGQRVGALRAAAHAWGAVQLSLLGRALVAKQVLANSVTYHASLVQPMEEQLDGMQRIVMEMVVRSALPEDATGIAAARQPTLRPHPEVARLPKQCGGIALVDLRAHVTALQAKAVVRALGPGSHPWQLVWRRDLAAAAPLGRPGLWWVASAAPLELCGPGLSPQQLAAVQAWRAVRAVRLQPAGALADARGLLCEPLYYNTSVLGRDRQPLVPPLPLPEGWPLTVGELRAGGPSMWVHPFLAPVWAALPAGWATVVTQPLPAGGWRVAPAGDQALSPEGRVFEVGVSGALDGRPADAQPPQQQIQQYQQQWPEACVLDMPKPRALWTYDERRAYGEAAPAARADLLPQQPFLLGRWTELGCFLPAHGLGRHPLHLFTVRDCRTHMLQLAAAAELGGGPVRPAAWPPPAGGASALEAAEAALWEQRPRSQQQRLRAFVAPLGPVRRLGQPTGPRRAPRDRSGPGPSAVGGGVAGGSQEDGDNGSGGGEDGGARGPDGAGAAALAAAQHGATGAGGGVGAGARGGGTGVGGRLAAAGAVPAAGAGAGAGVGVGAGAGPRRPNGGPGPSAVGGEAASGGSNDDGGNGSGGGDDGGSRGPGGAGAAALAAVAQHGATGAGGGAGAGGSGNGPGGGGQRAAAGAVPAAGAGEGVGARAGVGVGAAEGARRLNGYATATDADEAAAVKQAWRRLWRAGVCNRTKSLAWRLMHGRLPCGAYRALHGGRDEQFWCDHGACRQRRADVRPAATLTHLFVQCPRYAAARQWLADTWQAVAGHAPPLTAAVLLGDSQSAWPEYPAAAAADLWTCLRLTWLFSLWCVHSRASPSERHAHAVVAATVRTMGSLIRASWCFCLPERRIFGALPQHLLTRAVEEEEVSAFSARWSGNGRFCVVTPAQQQGEPPVMRVLLSMQHPVAAPTAPA